MGNTQASNTVDAAVVSSTKILNKTVQDCTTKSNNTNIVVINDCQPVNITNVTFNNLETISTTCAQKNTSNTDIKNQIDEEMTQLAKTLTAALNAGKATSSNIINTTTDLSTTIINTYTQDCINSSNNTNEISITCSTSTTNAPATISGVIFTNYSASTLNCVQTSDDVIKITNQIKLIISQTAIAETAPLIGGGMLLLILIFVAIYMIFEMGEDLVSIFIMLLIITIVSLIIYGITAYIMGWAPFTENS